MFEIAAQVLRWTAAGRQVFVARVVPLLGVGAERPGDALAWTPDAGAVGELVSGAVAAARLADLQASWGQRRARVVDLVVASRDAKAVGLPCGGRVTLLVQPADQIPEQVWRLLVDREPVCVVTDVTGDNVGRSTWLTVDSVASGHDDAIGGGAARHRGELLRMFGRGATQTAVTELAEGRQVLATAYWPTPRLLVVGGGVVADALHQAAALLGWEASTTVDAAESIMAATDLKRSDGLVVLSHDLGLAGEVLRAALGSAVGYVGALGSRRTQAARARWLAGHGVSEESIRSIRGPAGLDLGARGPAEIAVAIVAEILAVHTGSSGEVLRDRPGPVHLDQAVGRPWSASSPPSGAIG